MILNIIKQRLKDIELQRWLSDVNNDVRKDANQKNKLRDCAIIIRRGGGGGGAEKLEGGHYIKLLPR